MKEDVHLFVYSLAIWIWFVWWWCLQADGHKDLHILLAWEDGRIFFVRQYTLVGAETLMRLSSWGVRRDMRWQPLARLALFHLLAFFVMHKHVMLLPSFPHNNLSLYPVSSITLSSSIPSHSPPPFTPFLHQHR